MNRKLKSCIVAAAFTAMLALCACGGAATPESQGGTTSGEAAPESMKAVHDEAMWETIEADHSKKMCLSCHPRDTIVAVNENYMDIEGLNPHASHTESYDCIKCHSLTDKSVLVCNTACHGGWHGEGDGWPLPNENWQNPTDEVPSADGEPIPHNAN